jgi:hypothetical protein
MPVYKQLPLKVLYNCSVLAVSFSVMTTDNSVLVL